MRNGREGKVFTKHVFGKCPTFEAASTAAASHVMLGDYKLCVVARSTNENENE